MARKPATKKEPKIGLAVALDFLKIAQEDKTTDLTMKSYCRLANGYAVAFDGIIAVGHPIEEELSVCPHTYRLIGALSKCKKAITVTQLNEETLVIKSGAFRAAIPCLNVAALPYTQPDAQAGTIDDTIKTGFETLKPLLSATAETTLEASILLQNNSMYATNRYVIFEYWHGINLPDGLIIPKRAIDAVVKVKAKLVGIGVSNATVTFHFDNGAWLRTQLYIEAWPDVATVLNIGNPQGCADVPPNLYEAIEAVAEHSTDGAIRFYSKGVCSHETPEHGASYEIDGLPEGLAFNAAHMLHTKGLAKKFDLVGDNGVSFFYGDNIRGAVSQRRN